MIVLLLRKHVTLRFLTLRRLICHSKECFDFWTDEVPTYDQNAETYNFRHLIVQFYNACHQHPNWDFLWCWYSPEKLIEILVWTFPRQWDAHHFVLGVRCDSQCTNFIAAVNAVPLVKRRVDFFTSHEKLIFVCMHLLQDCCSNYVTWDPRCWKDRCDCVAGLNTKFSVKPRFVAIFCVVIFNVKLLRAIQQWPYGREVFYRRHWRACIEVQSFLVWAQRCKQELACQCSKLRSIAQWNNVFLHCFNQWK